MLRRKGFFVFLSILLLLFITAGYYLAGAAKKDFAPDGSDTAPQPSSSQPGWLELTNPENILIAGIDKATSINGPSRPGPWRTDSIMLVRVDPLSKKIYCLSIPRDTRVYIPGHGLEKIAHAHAYGGMPLTITTIEKFTGVKVDHFVKVDYEIFARMVDITGGIEIDVQKELKTKYYHFIPGRQKMNGRQAYVYVNNRDEPMADIARIDRQQQFVYALLKKVQEEADTMDIAKLYLEFKKRAETSLSSLDLLKLALFARELNTEQIEVQTLPGQAQYINGLSYWIADPQKLDQISGEKFSVKEIGKENEK